MTAPAALFLHCYATDAGLDILDELLGAITEAGLSCPVFAGVVGESGRRTDAVHALRAGGVEIIEEADEGWEQLTMSHMRGYALRTPALPPAQAIGYIHTKGASEPNTWNDLWRRSMTEHVVMGWQRCMFGLDAGAEAVGCHWLNPETFPGMVTVPFFGGTFWWAQASFLAELPPVSYESRHEAEVWLGRGERPPVVLDLSPGWPGPDTCHTPRWFRDTTPAPKGPDAGLRARIG